VATLLGLAAGLVVIRLLLVGVVMGEDYRYQGQLARTGELELPIPRPGRLLDRNGLLLTGSRPQYEIEINPRAISETYGVDHAASAISQILDMPQSVIQSYLNRDADWAVLNYDASQEEWEALQQLELGGIIEHLWWSRVYPQAEIFAHIGGFVSGSGQGYYGLEGYYDTELRPDPIVWEGEIDPVAREPHPFEEGEVDLPIPGLDLELTLDLAVQTVAYQELARAMEEFRAELGTIIVMDPRTGAILAMVGLPTYDPRQIDSYLGSQEHLFRNPAIGLRYEPGSVFKIITMAAALDSGTVTRETTYIDTGEYEIGGLTVTNWDLGEYGEQDMTGLLVHSLNVGAAWLCDQMGSDIFYRYVRDFGFGQLTGVDLEGEVIGELRLPDDLEWVDSDLGANSYGQALAVTPIQMISAVAAVANDGRLVLPHVVSRRLHPNGSAETRQPVVRDQPISAETARIMTEMLVQVVEQGVPQAQVPGYRVAGKTGTADISVPGGYDPEGTVASFVGYGPASDPELIILVRLDRPQTSRWGSETAAVVFSRLASRLFPMLGILPTD
jgi:cell division protein FtsI/penicillin-binding protein 2